MFQDSLTKKIAEAAAQIKTEPKENEINQKSVEGAIEKIMREELKGNQHKIDANKNNKVDAHDFKLLRAQKEKANSQKFGKDVKEEAEQLDEIGDTPAGKQMLGKYIKKRTKQLPGIERSYQTTPYDDDEPMGAKSIKKYQKKVNKGIGRAVDRLTKEETEEIDEAKKTLWPGTPEYKAKHGTDKEKHEAKYGKSDVKKLAPYGYRDKSEYEKTKDMKEEVEELDELSKSTLGSYVDKADDSVRKLARTSLVGANPKQKESIRAKIDKKIDKRLDSMTNAVKKMSMKKEEVEELDELSKDTLKSYAGKVIDKTRTMSQGAKKQKHLTGLGKAMDKMKEEKSFSAMLESYKEGGLKYIASLVKEEPDNAEYTKEVENQKAKMDGKKKGGDVAKASVQAVKVEETEIQVINADIANGVDQIDIEERSLTEPEMKKKEEIVMSMKKKMPGFKERYGERAKSVMYATATKMAKKD